MTTCAARPCPSATKRRSSTQPRHRARRSAANTTSAFSASRQGPAGARLLRPARYKVHAVIRVLSDDTDPMVTVMKLDKAPQETYADMEASTRRSGDQGVGRAAASHPSTTRRWHPAAEGRHPVRRAGHRHKTLLAKAVANQTSATFLRRRLGADPEVPG